jgi:lipoprotein-releasing system ATP-binding protein
MAPPKKSPEKSDGKKIRSDALVTTRGLSKIYSRSGASALEVLRTVDLDIFPEDRIAILGKSGTGKSTLLHLLGTLEAPSAGKVLFLGQDVFAFNEPRLATFRNRELGFIFQFHYLMVEFTAVENVMMPALVGGVARKEARDKAEVLLAKVGLNDRLTHRPNQLSGGEQQRVAIARALMMSPKLLLTDEMTGNLDPVTGNQVFDLVMSLQSEFKMALVSVTHDEGMASSYNRVLRLQNGELRPEK